MRDELDFVVYAEEKGVPLLAGCKKCGLKFLTPPRSREPSLARSYLWNKFVVHLCTDEKDRRKPPSRSLDVCFRMKRR